MEQPNLDLFKGIEAGHFIPIDENFWISLIRCKLGTVYKSSPESILRVMFYIELDRERGIRPFIWESLKDLLADSEIKDFKNCTDKLIEETKTIPELNNRFKEIMTEIQESIKNDANGDGHKAPFQFEMDSEVPDLEIVLKEEIIKESSLIEFKTFTKTLIPIAIVTQLVGNSNLIFSTEELIGAITSSSTAVAFIGLAVVFLTTEVLLCIRDWWKGKITGARVMKHIIDHSVCFSAGVAGGLALGSVASGIGPIGCIAGGFLGWIWASSNAFALSNYLTQKLFGIPQSSALENAYNFLGVKMSDSNEEINKGFRKLCLQHHPDKGGNPEEFMKLQIHMGVIKAARGDI